MARKKKTASTTHSSGSCVCRFEFQHSDTSKVCIAGSFNDWHPTAAPMVGLGDGRWVKELTLPPGRYEYRFVVDGEWVDDPNAKEVAPNPHGGVNAVLAIG
jgi:1,4-alpha-glucan branching enzyme